LGSSASRVSDVGATSSTESALIEVLAGMVSSERVSVDSHFFDDLGADSMVMARFCARVRKRADLQSVSMKDIYRYPTIRSLAGAMADSAPTANESPVRAPVEVAAPASTLQYGVCGALQLLFFLGYCYLAGFVAALGYRWIFASSGVIDLYVRSTIFGGACILGVSILPVLAKWILVGRWRPQRIRLWSFAYVRFWIVQTLVRSNPLALLFVGTPLYVLYLRALGTKIGPRVAIFSRNVPVCADLLTIGAGTVIRKEAAFLCYRAEAGWIQTGAVTLGRDVVVGEKTVLDIDTSMGDGAQLGHSSSLHAGQAVPDGERWHGSPAQRTEVDYLRVAPARCGTPRRVIFSLLTLLKVLLLYVPLVEGGVYIVMTSVPALAKLRGPGTNEMASRDLYIDALVVSVVLFFGVALVGLLSVVSVPRLLSIMIKPDKVYPLYGFHYSLYRTITRMTNIKFFTYLFGDSSYIVHYLRCLGYDLSQVVQTGANFGMEVAHGTPYLCSVGSGTMIADGLSIINADFSSSSFLLSRASIGPRNFLGNQIAYPSQGRTGDNCLLATKVMVPLDGEIREGVGLLGSPCFEIPRSVERDRRFDHLRTGDGFRRRLTAKNRYDIRTMGFYLFARWLHVFLIALLGLAAVDLYDAFAQVAFAAFIAVSVLASAVYLVVVERCFTAFRALRPRFCSIYDPYFWWHERLWKVPAVSYFQVFNGTPFKNVIWRMLGVRIGRRVFDDGCIFTERTLVTIGDDCTLNAGSKIQCHSQEDGTFKSDRSTIGAGCTLGVGALVHYGVTMGEGSVLAPDSFLMKGEEIPQLARWGGNPARELRENHLHACRTGQPNHSDPRDRPAGQQGQPADLPGQQGQPRLHRGQRRLAAWRRRPEGNIRWK
jgi:non-ribosomal peptide synthetase-like protein